METASFVRLVSELGLRAMDHRDRPMLMEYLASNSPQMSEYTFTNLFSWNDPVRYIGEFQSHLICASHTEEGTCLLQPIGPNPSEVILALGSQFRVSWEPIDEVTAMKLNGSFVVEPLRDHFDYLYLRKDLASLEGPNFSRQRKVVRKFRKDFSPVVKRLEIGRTEECEEVYKRWGANKTVTLGDEADRWKIWESNAILTALRNYSQWNLQGFVVEIDSVTQAFALGEALNPDTFVIHFSKTGMDDPGLPRFVLNEIAGLIDPGFTFVNRMQDLGISGLREAKLSWNPIDLVKKFQVRYSF